MLRCDRLTTDNTLSVTKQKNELFNQSNIP